MARKRMLAPTIWEDPAFNKLSPCARLLFIGMISNADDEGFVRADAGSLRRLVFGFDENPNVSDWINEIKKHIRSIHFYEVDTEKYAHFVKWDTYQKQQRDRMIASTYPKCSICLAPATQMLATDKQLLKEVKVSKGRVSKDKLVNTLKGAEALEWNKKLFQGFVDLKISVGADPKERQRYPRLMRKKDPDVQHWLSVAKWGEAYGFKPKNGEYVQPWRGKLTLPKLYFDIYKKWDEEVQAKGGLKRLTDMKKGLTLAMPK